MARGCVLLRKEVEASKKRGEAYMDICRQTQLDLRLATLASALKEIGAGEFVQSVACLALSTSPEVLDAGGRSQHPSPRLRSLIRRLVRSM